MKKKLHLTKFTSIGLFAFLLILTQQLFAQTVVTNPGSPWIVPTGVTLIKVEAWGGGGAGGGSQNTLLANRYGGGGGGGAYSTVTINVTPGDSYNIAVGAGGTAPGANSNGLAGGTSTVNGPLGLVLSVPGGAGGLKSNGSTGGLGGAGAISTFNGGNGGNASGSGASGGGGAGNAASAIAGAGGLGNPNAAPYKGGNGGGTIGATANGRVGTAPGGGGGGSASNTATATGGAGGAGQVLITYCTNYDLLTTTAQSPRCATPGTSTITVTSGSLPVGTYTVTYNRSSPAATDLTATMNVTIANSGSFVATGLTVVGSSTITVTKLATSVSTFCSNTLTGNTTADVIISDPATANAGPDQVICSGIAAILNGSFGGSATAASWSGGTGTFDPDNTTMGALYIPSAAEITAGTVTLTLLTNNPAGTCPAVSDQVVIALKKAPTAVAVSPLSGSACLESGILLTGTANAGSNTLSSENFNVSGSYSYTTAGSNSGGGTAFSQQNSGYTAGLTAINNNDGSKFMIATATAFGAASTNSQLTSPTISTSNYSTLSLTFRHTYARANELGVSVQVSTNGGGSWSNISTAGAIISTNTYTGNQGSATNFANVTINLGNFINTPGFRLRFNYGGIVNVGTSYWAIDDVALNGVLIPLYAWSSDTGPGIDGLSGASQVASAANKNTTAFPTAATMYTVTATHPLTNCTTTSEPATITIYDPSAIARSSATGTDEQSVCNLNQAITEIAYDVTGSATGATVAGLPAGLSGLYNAGVFRINGTPTVSGIFNYTVSTTGPCVAATATGTITVRALPTGTIVKTNVSACNGNNDGSITVTPGGTGPFSYSWTGIIGSGNPATTPYPNPGNVSAITGLIIGYYNVAITDGTGCTGSITGIHIQYAFSSYITNSGSVSSACGNTGSIILYVNAGVGPYTYSLDGTTYSTNNTFTDLAAGNYTGYVKDAAGCVSTKPITIASAPPIVVTPIARGASSCAPDGSVEIYRTGGIPPYTYSMDNITYVTTNKFFNLAAGDYTAYVKDSKGCIGSQLITVAQGIGLTVTASKTNTSTCTTDGTIQVNASGGVPGYTYSNDGGINYQVSNSFTGLGASTYPISVKDSKGCLGTLNVTINLNPIGVTSTVSNASNCLTSNGSIQLFRTGGVGPYTYSLDGNSYQSSTTFTGLAAGTYDGFVKDSKTCIGVQNGIVVGPVCRQAASKGITTVTSSSSKVTVLNSAFNISAFPNPSNAAFTLVVSGNNNEKVVVSVTDVAGRIVYRSEGSSKQQFVFGNDLIPGVYILQAAQGDMKQNLKLIKK